MTRALLGKEFREHWPVLLALCALAAAVFGLLVLGGTAAGDPSFIALRSYLISVVPLAAWILGGRLVRHEYTGGTWLFLEALPVSRSAVIRSKYVLGGITMAALTLPALAVCALVGMWRSAVDGDLLTVVCVRLAAWTWFVHSAAFLFGLLGKLRGPLLITVAVAVILVQSGTDGESAAFGPLRLVDSTFAFERHDMPWSDLAAACLLSVGATAAAWGLAHVREGSVAGGLAQQMSHREKAFSGVLVLLALFAVAAWRDRRPKPPFDPPAAARREAAGVTVVTGDGSGLDPAVAQAWADTVCVRLTAMKDELGIASLPPVYLFSRSGLDVRRYELGTIEDEAGVVVRGNRGAAGWDEEHFGAWLVREVVRVHTKGRAEHEWRRWVLDGYGLPRDRDDARLVRRALAGAPDGITADDLHTWDRVRDRLGPEIACAVAWSGLRALESERGTAAVRVFLAAALGTVPPDDFRALGWESRHGIPELLGREAGISEERFVAVWNEWLGRERARAGGPLPAPPSASIRFESGEDGAREAFLSADAARCAAPGASVRFQWAPLGPFDTFVAEPDWRSEDFAAAEAAVGVRVAEPFHAGQRIAWRVTVRSESLGCDLTSPLRRLVIE